MLVLYRSKPLLRIHGGLPVRKIDESAYWCKRFVRRNRIEQLNLLYLRDILLVSILREQTFRPVDNWAEMDSGLESPNWQSHEDRIECICGGTISDETPVRIATPFVKSFQYILQLNTR